MKNYIQEGDIVTVTAPYALASGDGCLVGSLFGVSTGLFASGATTAEIKTEGVFDLTALSTDTGSVGTKMYWDNTNKRLTTTLTSNVLVGCLLSAKASGETTARIYIDGTIR